MNDQAAHNEYDMLKGNVNRMFLTDDMDELVRMYEFAIKSLKNLYEYHCVRLAEAMISIHN